MEKMTYLFMGILCLAIVAIVLIGTIAVFKVGGILLGLYTLSVIIVIIFFVIIGVKGICIG